MSYAVSIVQLVMYAITMVVAIAEAGTSVRTMIVLKQYDNKFGNIWLYSIGGIAHGIVLVIYFIIFFAMYRRNSGFVKTKADLMINALLILVAVPVGVFCNVIAFGTVATLLISFVTEWIYVATRKVPSKWSKSLHNVCADAKHGSHGGMGVHAAQPISSYGGHGGFQGSGPYGNLPSANSSFMHPQPYQAVPNPGGAPPYQYSTPYGQPQQQGQWH